jgi:competence protein ComEA
MCLGTNLLETIFSRRNQLPTSLYPGKEVLAVEQIGNLPYVLKQGEVMNEALARYRYVLFFIATLALAGAVGYGLVHRPPAVTFTVLPPPPTPLPTPAPTIAPLHCHVVGPVNAPGVYTLPPGSLVQDALQAAGGPTADADIARLNLSAVVQDQQQIVVPSKQLGLAPKSPGILLEADTGLVNINSATSEMLQTLPSIGPALAERIIAYREEHGPFATTEDLVQVKGIGQATLEKLQPLITVGP